MKPEITRTLRREGWLITAEGETLRIARSDQSDWLDIPVESVGIFCADLQELAHRHQERD